MQCLNQPVSKLMLAAYSVHQSLYSQLLCFIWFTMFSLPYRACSQHEECCTAPGSEWINCRAGYSSEHSGLIIACWLSETLGCHGKSNMFMVFLPILLVHKGLKNTSITLMTLCLDRASQRPPQRTSWLQEYRRSIHMLFMKWIHGIAS